MRIGCLQLSPTLGSVHENIQQADSLLSASGVRLGGLDLLVLPELAFTGYNFPSLSAISPFLEPTSSGPSTRWAHATAKRLNCLVSVGYPEIATLSDSTTRRYNATVTVSPTGAVLAHYRKAFLYYTDATWASEGPDGFWSGVLPLPLSSRKRAPHDISSAVSDGASHTYTNSPLTGEVNGRAVSPSPTVSPVQPAAATVMGICMDLNPKDFTAPWTAYEFANHIVDSRASLAILTMAWLTRLSRDELAADPKQPDMETFSYWIERLAPVIEKSRARMRQQEQADHEGFARDGAGETIVVVANRTGEEPGRDPSTGLEGTRYAGTSAVLGINGGAIRVFGIMGRAEEGVLVVDTDLEAPMVVRRP